MARKSLPPRGPQLKLAGDLSVAFVNTAGAHEKNRQQGVGSYAELLTWSQQAGVLQALEVERLSQMAAERPEAAQAVCTRMAEVRVALAGLFIALQADREKADDDLRTVNDALAEAMPAVRMVHGEEGLTWGWAGDPDALDRMLWPVLHAASQLLVSTRGQPHVRQCALSGCMLFFVDRTPSGQRRWCEMKTCGTRAKSLRYYRKTAKAARDRKFWGTGTWLTKRPRPSKKKV